MEELAFYKLQLFVYFIVIIAPTTSQEIEIHPENANVSLGSSITLQCQLNTVHNCTWHKKDDPININERYKYLDSTANGINTINCSIVIHDFREMDANYWQCSYSTNENASMAVKSNKAYLSMQPLSTTTKATTIAPPKDPNTTESNTSGISLSQMIIILPFSAIVLLVLILVVAILIRCFRRNKAKKVAGARESTANSEHQYEQVIYNTNQMKSKEDDQGYLVPIGSQSKHTQTDIPECPEKSQNDTSNKISFHANQSCEYKIQPKIHIYENIPE